ncbi:hypothetical protein [Hymenobacter chitinivorans]|uniref:Uncharacterized protein n=1 Tax=Hymenobacter chitinivorans DSM 11115 TaxID=1121954 RepID=A0A2M9B944_9BACT|nr:hypothetical protein [Hymenobacter chitinivorans]PJJ54464.1 hypothetical protein CLV45_2802 [Hymenobacter chitinivorans DSM 11115]
MSPTLARIWYLREVRKGPHFTGMASVSDKGTPLDLTHVKTSAQATSQLFWLDEHDGKQRLRLTEPGRPDFCFEVVELTAHKLVLTFWVTLPNETRPRHYFTEEYEAGLQASGASQHDVCPRHEEW